MPTYTAKCAQCGQVISYIRPLARRDEVPYCCQQPTERQLDAPAGYVDTPAAK